MYLLTLLVHSMILRWLVLLAVLVRAVTAGLSRSRGAAWSPFDRRLSLIAMILADTQVLVGFVMYAFLSPNTHQAFADPGAAMKNGTLRFYLVEHPTIMILAVAALHVGNVLTKRASDDRRRFTVTAVSAGIALLFLLVGMFMPH